MKDIFGVMVLFLLALVCMMIVAPELVDDKLTTDEGHEIIPPKKSLGYKYAAAMKPVRKRITIDGETIH